MSDAADMNQRPKRTRRKPAASPTDAAIIARATGDAPEIVIDGEPTPARPKKPRKTVRSKKPTRARGGWRRAMRVIFNIVMYTIMLGMFASGFAGYVPPSAIKGVSVLHMTFPGWLLALIVMTVLAACFNRRALIPAVITWVGCIHPILEFSPLNFVRPSISSYPASARFSFLTYNVINFTDLTDRYDGGVNPTLSYIMRTNADIVNVQEAVAPSVNSRIHITAGQLDSLHALYPYIMMYGRSQMVMSKFPIEVVHTGEALLANAVRKNPLLENNPVKPTGEIAVFRADIHGTPVTIFDLHLQSYNLTPGDKDLYREITDIKDRQPVKELKSTLKDVRSSLFSKIHAAAIYRQADCEYLKQLIDHYGGPNIIVAGDFNDLPGCYTIHELEDQGFRSVYSEVGLGPMITYNANRFYFRIDHVLYRGGLRPLRMVRGNSRTSDHYPLLTTFAITKKQ